MLKTVLIADDDKELADILSRQLVQLGIEVATENDGMSALNTAERMKPDAMILDMQMPNGNGIAVCEMLASHSQLQTTPVIILTGSQSQDVVRQCHRLCAYYVPKGSNSWSRIEPLIREILELDESLPNQAKSPEESRASVDVLDSIFAILGVETGDTMMIDNDATWKEVEDGPWVLSIEDDEDVALALKIRLSEIGVKLVHITEGRSGYREAFENPPNAILLDYELPEGNGDYVLRRLKESQATSNIPVIVLTGRREGYIHRQMQSLGADAFFTKPLSWDLLKDALSKFIEQPT